MHAASVHPEPGSNSLKIVYQSEASLPNVITFIRVISMLYYYLRAFVNSKEFSESFLVHCCSIFNERFPFARRRSRRQPVYYITSARLCQEVFQNFFKFFSISFFEVRFCDRRLFRDDFVIISHPVSFVKRFFKLF